MDAEAEHRPAPADFASLGSQGGHARGVGEQKQHVGPHRGERVAVGGLFEVGADVFAKRAGGLLVGFGVGDIVDGIGLCPGGNQCLLRDESGQQRAG